MAETAAVAETAASAQVWHELAQTLHREARLIDEERFAEWLASMVHPEIHYQVYNRQLRLRRDRRFTGAERVYSWDDRLEDIQLRIKSWESGMQWSADPKECLRHHVGSIEVYLGENAEQFIVHANCWVVRNRRVYEEMTFSYGRKDVWERRADGHLLLKRRECDVDERFIHGKNLAFFL